MIRSDSISKISAALLQAQRKMGDATKGSKNPFYKSSYADLNSIREVVTPSLNEQGISITQPIMMMSDGTSYVETTLLHESGEYLGSQFPIVTSKANDSQAFGSAVSYARRYALQSFLSVGAIDDDAETSMGRKGTGGDAPKAFTAPPTSADQNTLTSAPTMSRASFSKKAANVPKSTTKVEDDI